MRAGFFQFDVVFDDKQANLEKVRCALARSDFDMVVLPELFNTGCLFTSLRQARDLAEPTPDGETTRALLDIARTRNIFIIGGLVEQERDRLYNTAVIVGPQGFVGKHRKVHLSTSDTAFFTPGEDFNVFDILGVRVGILLCYDCWLPWAGKALAAQGATLICHPANFFGEDSLEMISGRARELSVYTVTANRLGLDHDTGLGLSFIGASQIVNPDGVVIHSAGKNEMLFVADIPP